jgi:ribosomal protein L19
MKMVKLLQNINKIYFLQSTSVSTLNIMVGDIIICRYREVGIGEKVRQFKGKCISISRTGNNKRVVLRNVFGETAAEYSFYLSSNRIIELLRINLRVRSTKKKLYYLRYKPIGQSKVK